MSNDAALLDANVLYPAIYVICFCNLRWPIYSGKWTADIHHEWMGALLRNEPHRDRDVLERTRGLMDKATRDCLVSGYEGLTPSLRLPDPDDRHVLAAAIIGRCDVIVTQHLKHFPDSAPAPYQIDVQHPPPSAIARSGSQYCPVACP
jgi:hypothetical protein